MLHNLAHGSPAMQALGNPVHLEVAPVLADTDIGYAFELFSTKKDDIVAHADLVGNCFDLSMYRIPVSPVVDSIEGKLPLTRDGATLVAVRHAGKSCKKRPDIPM